MTAQRHPSAHLLEVMCSLSGVAKFTGVFGAFRNTRTGRQIEALCLFTSIASGTALALPLSKMSATAVRKHTLESNVLFEQFQNKACQNILRQFASTEPA